MAKDWDRPPRYTDDRIAVTMIIDLRDGTSVAETVAIPVDGESEDKTRLLLSAYDHLYLKWSKSNRVPSEDIPRDGFEQEYEV